MAEKDKRRGEGDEIMKQLALPENSFVEYTGSSAGYGHPSLGYPTLYPYRRNHTDLMRIIESCHINVPFESVVSRCDGMSECAYCKAKYVGHQPKCTNMVWLKKRPYSFERTKDLLCDEEIFMGECGHYCKWDKEDEFRFQEQFFSFVSLIGDLSTSTPNEITAFARCLPTGMALEYQLYHIDRKLFELEYKTRQAIDAIVNKMNMAGTYLQF